MLCLNCGQVHVSGAGGRPCKGHIKFHTVDGERIPYPENERPPCRGNAMTGQDICHAHGGRAPQNKAAGQARETERKAAALMLTYGRPIQTTATEALLDEVKWTAGHVQWLREQVQKIEIRMGETAGAPVDDLVWGKTKHKIGGDDAGTTWEAGPNVFLTLYQQERTHLVKVCSEAIRAGIEERKVRLAEKQGEMVADVITRILDDLKLTPEQAATVSIIVPRHLRLLTA